ncbi:MAG: hypothetical protein ACTJLL_02540 [Anaplasma sp.]
MIYFDHNYTDSSNGDVYMHIDPYAVLQSDGGTKEHRVDYFCPATFTRNDDDTVHFKTGAVFADPDNSNIHRDFVVSGDLEYLSYYEAKLRNFVYLETQYMPNGQDEVTANDALSWHYRGSVVPLEGRISFEDRRSVVFQHPNIAELILRVPQDMRSPHEFVMQVPEAC